MSNNSKTLRLLLPAVLLLLMVASASTSYNTSFLTSDSSSGATGISGDVSWFGFLRTAVQVAPDGSNMLLLTDSSTGLDGDMVSDSAWSISMGTMMMTCNSRATDIRSNLDKAWTDSGRTAWVAMMLCSLPDTLRIFGEIKELDLSVSWLRWIVLGDTKELLAAGLESLPREADQVTAVEYLKEEDRYKIYNSLPVDDRNIRLVNVGIWKFGNTVVQLGEYLYPRLKDMYSDMKGRELRIAVIDNWPFFGLTTMPDGTLEPASGIDHSIVEALAETLNFTYRIVTPEDQQWGVLQKDGTFSGMMGMLTRREADFAIDEITVTGDRETVVDFTHPYYVESSVILTRAPAVAQMTLAIFLPFSNTVWGCLVATVFVVTAGVVLLICCTPEAMQHSTARSMRIKTYNPFKSLFVMYRSLVNQGNDFVMVQQTSMRIIIGAWIFFCQIVYAMYQGTLTAVLAVPSMEVPINSLSELLAAAEEGRIIPAILRDSSVEALLLEAEDGVYHELSKYLTPDSFIESTENVVLRVLPGDQAYMAGGLAIELRTARKGSHRFYLGRDRFYMQNYGVACQSASPIKLVIEPLLSRLVCSGLIQRFKNREVQKAASKVKNTGQNKAYPALTLTHLQGGFYVFLMGIGSSVLAFILERNIHKKRTADSAD